MFEWTKAVSVPLVWHKRREKRAVLQMKTEETDAPFQSKVGTLLKDCIGIDQILAAALQKCNFSTNEILLSETLRQNKFIVFTHTVFACQHIFNYKYTLIHVFIFTNISVYNTYVLPRKWWRTPFEWNILDRKKTTILNRSEQHDTYFLEDKLWFQIIYKTLYKSPIGVWNSSISFELELEN